MALLTSENKVLVWGSNSYGQLGLNDVQNRNEPTLLSLADNDGEERRVQQISCGKDFTFVVLESNEIFVSGHLPFQI